MGHAQSVNFFVEECDHDTTMQKVKYVFPIESAVLGNQLSIVKYLVRFFQLVLKMSHVAVEAADVEMVEYFIHTLHCNYSGWWEGNLPLHRAVLCGKFHILRYFLTTLNCDLLKATAIVVILQL